MKQGVKRMKKGRKKGEKKSYGGVNMQFFREKVQKKVTLSKNPEKTKKNSKNLQKSSKNPKNRLFRKT
jgi:hypothetical protein